MGESCIMSYASSPLERLLTLSGNNRQLFLDSTAG